jgi:hypothetical protein
MQHSRSIHLNTVLTPINLLPETDSTLKDIPYFNQRPEYHAASLMLQSLLTEKRTSTTGLCLPKLRFDAYTSRFGRVFSQLYPTSAINASLIWKIPL